MKAPDFMVRNTVQDWAERGVIDDATAQVLLDDLDAQNQSRIGGLTGFLIAAALICLFFAALSFVAANWEAIPRLSKLALLAALMWITWGTGLVLRHRGKTWLGEGLIVLANGFLGLSIMLVAQIYHMQGEAEDAVWMWAMGATLGAALARSPATLLGCVLLWVIWLFMHDFAPLGAGTGGSFAFLIPLAVLAGLAIWMRARPVGHALAIGLLLWEVRSLIAHEALADELFYIFAVAHFVLVALCILARQIAIPFSDFATRLVFYLVFAVLLQAAIMFVHLPGPIAPALTIWLGITAMIPLGSAAYLYKTGKGGVRDSVICALAIGVCLVIEAGAGELLAAAFLLALAIWSMRMGWRFDTRALRWLGMGGFIIGMIVLYVLAVGDTLMGTAGFFLGAAVILLISLFIARLIDRYTKGGAA